MPEEAPFDTDHSGDNLNLEAEPTPSHPSICVIGQKGSGKTTMFRALYRALQTPGIDLKSASLVDDEERNPYFFSPETSVSETPKRKSLHYIDHTVEPSREVYLDLIDPPGEVFERVKNAEAEKARVAFFNSIVTCDGILIIISATGDPAKWEQLVERELPEIEQKRGNRKLKAAVVVSKADRLPFFGRVRPTCSKAWVKNRIPTLVSRLGQTAFSEARYFFFSSVGWSGGIANYRTIYNQRSLLRSSDEVHATSAQLIPNMGVNGSMFEHPLQVTSVRNEKAAAKGDLPEHVFPDDAGVSQGLGACEPDSRSTIRSNATGWNVLAPFDFLVENPKT